MDVKDSARPAKRYIAELFEDENITDIRLEEVELGDPPAVWRITVSFLREVEATELPGDAERRALGFGVLRPPRPGQRSYKTVEIDDASGQVRAVKLRLLEAVD